jgi:hypothetical protein
MNTLEELRRLEEVVKCNQLPKAKKTWGGAGVIITTQSWETNGYSEPQFVVTPHALEVSWLFDALKDAFYAERRLDSCSKLDFFDRLASAANQCITEADDASVQAVCAAVIQEAFLIYDEMENNNFRYTPIAFS